MSRSELPPVAAGRPDHGDERLTWLIRATNSVGRLVYRCFAGVTVEGLEHVPRHGPLIVASNHISNADPPLIHCWLTPVLARPVHWMAKQEALEWPIAGPFMRANGAFGIRRGAADLEAFKLARRVLEEGRVLGVFPEGTRSPTGALQQAKDGVTLLALRSGAPVLPIAISGTEGMWPRGQRLPHPRGHVRMRVGEPFVLKRTAGAGHREDLATATDRLMLEIARLLPERYRGHYGAAVAATPDRTASNDADPGAPGRVSTDPVR